MQRRGLLREEGPEKRGRSEKTRRHTSKNLKLREVLAQRTRMSEKSWPKEEVAQRGGSEKPFRDEEVQSRKREEAAQRICKERTWPRGRVHLSTR